MRKTFSLLISAAALMFSTAVSAQTIDLSYKSSDNKAVVNLKNAKSIKASVGKLRVDNAANNYDEIVDNGGVYAAIIADPKFLAIYLQVGATTEWVNAEQIADATCQAGTKTRVLWQSKWQYASTDLADNCTVFNAWLNRTAN